MILGRQKWETLIKTFLESSEHSQRKLIKRNISIVTQNILYQKNLLWKYLCSEDTFENGTWYTFQKLWFSSTGKTSFLDIFIQHPNRLQEWLKVGLSPSK